MSGLVKREAREEEEAHEGIYKILTISTLLIYSKPHTHAELDPD
jgi:hypothetical protein